MPHAEAVGDHEVRELGERAVAADASLRQRPVQRGAPARSLAGRIATLEPEELLERGQDGPDGMAQVVGGGGVAGGVHERAV